MASVIVLQHHENETLGTIGDALQARRIETRIIAGFAGEPIPRQMGEAAGLIVLGGPMGVSEGERYSFLQDEIRLIGDALSSNLPILGVCLGGQLLAHTLGATVGKAALPEIGWHPLRLTEAARRDRLWTDIPSPCTAFHWHGDMFALPAGAVALASSEMTPCQAFRYGENAYGLQCHLEVTSLLIDRWLTLWEQELTAANADSYEIRAHTRQEIPHLQQTAHTLFGAWANLLHSKTPRSL